MQHKLPGPEPKLICLMLFMSFPSVATVLISPALPAIGDYFNISNGYAQQLITVAVLGYAIGQLLYSPFANRFGRKFAAYLGVILYIVGCCLSLISIYLHSFDIILIGRLLMLLGASAGMVISFTIINDFYYARQARTITSYTVIAFALMPAVSILFGGYVTTHLSWLYCFYFFLLYGLFILFVVHCLPETLQTKEYDALQIRTLIKGYSQAFTHWQLMIFSIIYGLMTAFVYIIASGAPFIGIDHIGLTPAHYSMLILIPYCGQMLGGFSAGKLSKYLSIYTVLTIGYSLVISGSLFMLISYILDWINAYSLFIPIFLIMCGLPMTYSSVTVMAAGSYHDKAIGSSVMSFTTMGLGFVATLIWTAIPNEHPMAMPLLFLAVIAIAISAFVWAKNHAIVPNT